MLICPQCRTTYPAGAVHCRTDGFALVDARQHADAEGDPLVGQTIAGRFRIEARIGTGGMGSVYRAVQSGLNRQVALKILKEEVSWDRDAVTRFHREAKAMSLLVHANTVRVFDFGETDDGLLYLAMELLEGEVLTEKSEREGPLEVVGAVRTAQQILASLHEAHSKGLIHRDLKPDNIFLARVEGHAEHVVKVLDFGIAKAWQGDRKLDQLETQAGTVFGTPRYMSPEQAQGHRLDPRSDLYGVGILLYQMLAGRPPFVDDDAVVVMAKHIRERPEPVRRVVPDRPIPHSLERAVMKAIAKDPAKRFQSADEMIARLEHCLPEAEAAANASGLNRRVRAALASAPRGALAVAGGLLVGAIAVSAYLLAGSGEPSRAQGPTQVPTMAGPATAGNGQETTPPQQEPEEPAPERVAATLDSEPEGAEVWHDGTRLGVTPLRYDLAEDQHMQVELRLDGYETAETELVAGEPGHTIELERTSSSSRRARRARMRREARRAARRQQQTQGSSEQQSSQSAPEPAPSKDEPYERFD